MKTTLSISLNSRTEVVLGEESPSYQFPRRKYQKRCYPSKIDCLDKQSPFRNYDFKLSLLEAQISTFQALPYMRLARPSNPLVYGL
jgi:hypothetical protein